MTLLQRLERFKNSGWTYKDGVIYSHQGLAVKYRVCSMNSSKKGDERCDISKGRLAWYLHTGKIPTTVYHIDGDKNNTKWENLTDDSNFRRNKGGRPRLENVITTIKTNRVYALKEPVQSIELNYEVILSLGKGRLTKRAETIFITLVNNLAHKFYYYNDQDAEDCKSEAMLAVFTGWKNFNPDKFDNAFPYITEIAKRGFAKGLAKLQGKNLNSGFTPTNISINNFRQ